MLTPLNIFLVVINTLQQQPKEGKSWLVSQFVVKANNGGKVMSAMESRGHTVKADREKKTEYFVSLTLHVLFIVIVFIVIIIMRHYYLK